jgi:sulfite exporter TauE/SafE
MLELITSAFIAGLIGSPHCIGMCGVFASACSRSLPGHAAWHAGRLTTYAALGALAGWAGHLIPGPGWIALVLSALLLVWFAGTLAGVLPQLSFVFPGIARAGSLLLRRTDVASRYAFGLLTALLPCAFLYFGVSFAIATASPLGGALALVAFGLGTVPALASLSGFVHGLATRSIWARRAVALLILTAGLWSLGLRGVKLYSHSMPTHAMPSSAQPLQR